MENYLDKLPDVIDSVATNQFYPNLLSWLSSFIAFDNAIVYSFEKDAPPRFLSKVEKRNSDSVNRIYQRGAYLMDPFYQELQKGRFTGADIERTSTKRFLSHGLLSQFLPENRLV